MSDEHNFCSECEAKLYPFEKKADNHLLDGVTCSGCSLNKHKEKLLNKNHE